MQADNSVHGDHADVNKQGKAVGLVRASLACVEEALHGLVAGLLDVLLLGRPVWAKMGLSSRHWAKEEKGPKNKNTKIIR